MSSRKPASGSSKSVVIVPTYKEHDNLRPLTERIFAACKKEGVDNVELVIVDDNSRDGSQELVEELSKSYPVRIEVRTKERGLSSAVLHGFKLGAASGGERLVCMDADLQHPPEKIPAMIKTLMDHEYVLGTRYGKEFAVDKDWPMYRVIISKGARLLARPLTPLSDPMSGFFGLTKSAYSRGEKDASGLGFKIALELFVKCRVKNHGEVPIFFSKRVAGESKLDGKVMIYYIQHLIDLYRFRFPLLFPILIVLLLVLAYIAMQFVGLL